MIPLLESNKVESGRKVIEIELNGEREFTPVAEALGEEML